MEEAKGMQADGAQTEACLAFRMVHITGTYLTWHVLTTADTYIYYVRMLNVCMPLPDPDFSINNCGD